MALGHPRHWPAICLAHDRYHRYAHAKQFNRHRRQLRILRTRLGRIIRDIRRKIAGQEPIAAVFENANEMRNS
jgi:hypothetical protein